MTGNTFGERFRVTSFGESHGRCVGIIVDGCPAGLKLTREDIQAQLERRRPGLSQVSTERVEEDRAEILSGLFRGHTTGAPICIIIWNTDQKSSDYDKIANRPRPGHADLAAHIKYGGYADYRGGGRFSGRITAGFVAAGAIAQKLLANLGIVVRAHTVEIAGIAAGPVDPAKLLESEPPTLVGCYDPDASEKMVSEILKSKAEGDSVGGVIEALAMNVPPGLGEPAFDALDGELARAFFAIPAVKGVEFGDGFSASRVRGSQNNDQYGILNGRISALSNHAGGILGGISTGTPITCRVAIKPTPSISRPQKTVDIRGNRDVEIRIPGRHDPCIVPRALPVVEAMMAIVLADHLIRSSLVPPVLRVHVETRKPELET